MYVGKNENDCYFIVINSLCVVINAKYDMTGDFCAIWKIMENIYFSSCLIFMWFVKR